MSVSLRCRSWITSGRAAICVFLLCFLIIHCDACSCKLEHPQMHYCNAHFAVVARIKSVRHDDHHTSYGIKMIKQFKMNEKANYAFKHTRNYTNAKLHEIYSPKDELVCGVHLQKDQVYLLTGRNVEGKPRVGLCDYHQPWANMTTKQKKGFKLLYHKGCGNCQVVPCPWWSRKNCKSPPVTSCAWDTLFEGRFDCQSLESVCMKQSNDRCGWNRSTKFRQCLKDRKEYKEAQRQLEP